MSVYLFISSYLHFRQDKLQLTNCLAIDPLFYPVMDVNSVSVSDEECSLHSRALTADSRHLS